MKRQINSRFSSRRRGRAHVPPGNGEAGSLRWDGEPNSSLRFRQLSLRSARDSFLAELRTASLQSWGINSPRRRSLPARSLSNRAGTIP